MNILALVIARGGSKGIPGKNLRRLGGIPLVAYKIISARRCLHVSRVILSSDSAEIQEIGREAGAEIPFTRPPELASDIASSDDVAQHAMDWVEREGHAKYDALLLLEASTPFATSADYSQAVAIMQREQARMVVGMVHHKLHRVFIGEMDERGRIDHIVRQMESLRRLDRQTQKPNYTMNGAFYLMDWQHYRSVRRRYVEAESSYGVVMDTFRSIELDEPIDLAWAQFLIDSGKIDLSPWK